MHPLRAAAWILLGVVLGTVLSAALMHFLSIPGAGDTMSVASLAVVALLAASLRRSRASRSVSR